MPPIQSSYGRFPRKPSFHLSLTYANEDGKKLPVQLQRTLVATQLGGARHGPWARCFAGVRLDAENAE